MTGCATAVTTGVTKYVCFKLGQPPAQAVSALQALRDIQVDIWINELKRYYLALRDTGVCEIVRDLPKAINLK